MPGIAGMFDKNESYFNLDIINLDQRQSWSSGLGTVSNKTAWRIVNIWLTTQSSWPETRLSYSLSEHKNKKRMAQQRKWWQMNNFLGFISFGILNLAE